MSNFKVVEGEFAIVISGNGVYKDVPLYTRKGRYYLKNGGGYISANIDGSTSNSKVRMIFVSLDKSMLFKGGHSYMVEKHFAGAVPLNEKQVEFLTSK